MIFAVGHLVLFQIRHIGMIYFLKNGFNQLFDPENKGVTTNIMILRQLELNILSKLDFRGGHFEKQNCTTYRE